MLLLGLPLAAIVISLVVAYANTTSQINYPEQTIARGGTGSQAWSLVASGSKIDNDAPVACTELRDAAGELLGYRACNYRPEDHSRHDVQYNDTELPDGQHIWFGQGPDKAVTAELRFPGGRVVSIETVVAPGIPGRFFYFIDRPGPNPTITFKDSDGQPIRI